MRKANLNIMVAICVFLTGLTGPTVHGKLITVDDDAPANYSIIQDAINFASDGDEIEVRPGTYYQTVNFKGKAVRLYSRDGSADTIIDATGLNSSVVDCNSSEDANTILEGFTITGGNAFNGGGMHIIGSSPTVTNCIFTSNSASHYGGGMYNNNSSPTVTNCNFTSNSASNGGGMYNNNSSPTVTNCNFSGNQAISRNGGGMLNDNGSDPNVTSCIFISNTSTVIGGGMYNSHSSPTVTNCTFTGNSAESGGGMYNYWGNPKVRDCSFSGNTVIEDGGGIFNGAVSYPQLTNCTFSSNDANNSGGGIYVYGGQMSLTNCTFSNNSAMNMGGGIYRWNHAYLTNCVFHSNTANVGGGMYNYENYFCSLTNCTFSGNSASNGGGMFNEGSNPTVTNCTFYSNFALDGGGIFNNNGSNPTVTNCILWGNTPDQINDWDSPASTTTVSFSDVQGGWPGGVVVIDSDPLFVDAAGGDLRLSSPASPCVDTGSNGASGLPATDLAGNPRIVDGDRNGTAIVDMGAYEYHSWQIHNITQDLWYETIQLAIDSATKGDEIEVSPGTYYEAINFNGKEVRLYSSGGPEVTTIDGTGNYHVVQCVSGEGANTILEGFTITSGNANGTGSDARGGGMYNEYSSPTVTNCIFTNNSATGGGGVFNLKADTRLIGCTFSFNSATSESGGLHNHECDAIVTNCTFVGNTSVFGGAMSNPYSSPTVFNCTFLANKASEKGGGMYNRSGSTPMVTNCTFNSNLAQTYGGGMYNDDSRPMVTNCTFIKNESQASGGGIANYINSHSIVTNCTFSGNVTVGGDGGGIRNWDSSPIIKNCILWGNEHDEISSAGTSVPVVNYSDIQGGHIGTGNINTDPNFVDANNPDPNLVNLRLLPDSACIDAGDSTAVPLGISLDPDGNQRGLDDPASPDTGINVLGVTVDMGAYEYLPCPIAGDINCDGVVDFKDVAILCANWLASTEQEM